MRPRRVAVAFSTFVVAIVVALAVPVSQLRTISTVITCCCPDPSHCHCPDHQPGDHSKQSSLRACHKSSHELASTQLPTFAPPQIAIALASVRIAPAVFAMPRSPHAPPPPAQPDGPS